ncbi:MAG: alpha-2-macroglobulin family protein [Nitrospirae bacterium]|nr:alpha-2-macroglobulin family protein [Nitrospirota bacterium]
MPSGQVWKATLRRTGEALRRIGRQFFGSSTWAPPPWWDGARRARAAVVSWERSHEKAIRRYAVVLAALALVSGGIYGWYVSRPRPSRVAVTIVPPGPTKLEKDAKPDPLKIRFTASAARLEDVGKDVTKGIRLDPPHSGVWTWVSDQDLTFQPSEDWPVGQEYRLAFDRTAVAGHVLLEEYEIEFSSAPFEVSIESTELYQDPEDPKLKKVVSTISFSHPVDPAELERRVRLRMKDQSEGFLGLGAEEFDRSITYDKFKGKAFVHSGPVAIPLKAGFMVVTIEPGVRSARGGPPFDEKLEAKVEIPGMYEYFRVDSAELTVVTNERYEPEHVLVLTLTDGVESPAIRNRLTAHLLPKDLPSIQGRAAIKDYRWGDEAIVGPEVLGASSPIGLDALPTDRVFATVHSFRYAPEPGRYVYVRLEKGLVSGGGYVLAETYDEIVRVPPFPRGLKIMAEGAILSLAGERKLSIVSYGIEAVRFSVSRVLPGQINHIVSQTYGKFQNPSFQFYRFGSENLSETFVETRVFAQADPRKPQYTSLDLSRYLMGAGESRRGLFFLEIESWDPKRNKTTGLSDRRMILVTDLGLLVKEAQDGSRHVFVQSIASGRAVGGVQVQVIGKNGVAIVTQATGGDGSASFPDLADFERERTPTAIVATDGHDLSFIPYDWAERRLEFSRFETGGSVTGKEPDRLQAYLFSDRGIYRPGDEIRAGLIVKASDWRKELAGVPLEVVITDARGLGVQKNKIRLSAAAFEEIHYRTEENGPTGAYGISVYIVKDEKRAGLLASTQVRVEEFLPDRMTITTHLSRESLEGWVDPKGLKALVSLRTLFGTPAAGRRVSASLILKPASPTFKRYKDYTFLDPTREKKRSFSDRLEDEETDEQGEAEFDLALERFDRALYRLSFLAEGYEAGGGRGVSSESSALVSDLPYLLGYKPDGGLQYIKRGNVRHVHVIGVDPELKQIAADGLTAQVVEEQYVSVLVRQENGTYKYESVRKEVPVSSETVSIPSGGLQFKLPTDTPGDFALSFKDKRGTELLRAGFAVVGKADLTRSLDRHAELQVTLNKTDYAPGEEIEMQVRAPYTGAGLITIEREKVFAHEWFLANTTNTVQRIRVPQELKGNGYVNVAFVRSLASPEIFMSPLSYAVVPFTVSLEQQTHAVELDAPDLSPPGVPFRIRYRGSHRGKIVVFAVDEGILQVAGYKTPDPLSKFFQKRALEVDTSQIVDLILPEFRHLLALSAPGGDEYEALGKNLNPFKRKRDRPVAYWSGILDVGQDWREVVYDIPDYFNGTLRIMAVAVAPAAVGAAEKKSLVRGPFVLNPTVPTFVAPGDEFEVGLAVHNNVEQSGDAAQVAVEARASEHLEILGSAREVVSIDEGRERVSAFRVRARDHPGGATLTFKASLGRKSSTSVLGLSVRPAVAYLTTIAGGHVRGGKAEVPVPRKLYPHYRLLEVSVSTVPLILARGLTEYLNRFPYGCTEQLVSRALPALVLSGRPEFGTDQDAARASLQEAMRILSARQNAEGAFGFWAANSHVSPFQTVYALLFLTEARERGHPAADDMLTRGYPYLESLAREEPETLPDARGRAFAIYLLARGARVVTTEANTLRNWLEKNHRNAWEKDLTGVLLAATYKLLKIEGQAESLIKESRLGDLQEADYESYYDGLLRDAGYLFVLSRHFPERLRSLSADDLLKLAEPITQERFSTISAGMAILALDAYTSAVGAPRPDAIALTEIHENGRSVPVSLPEGLFPKAAFSPEAVKLHLKTTDRSLIFYQAVQAGFEIGLPPVKITNGIEIHREIRAPGGIETDSTRLGNELEVRLKIRSLDDRVHADVAVVDLLPGGFEVKLDPEDGVEKGLRIGVRGTSWRPDYADVREDRVLLFGTVPGRTSEFVYRIGATNKGTYVVPPVFAEAMYDRSVRARGLAGKIVVGDRE